MSFTDANVGRVVDALEKEGFRDNTIVLLWGDREALPFLSRSSNSPSTVQATDGVDDWCGIDGWHLGDQNSWGKMTLFEAGTRNAMLWCVPGQCARSKGLNTRY